MIRLIVATRNRHKLEEIRSILGKGVECLGLDQWKEAPPLPETGKTFEENATQKAMALAQWLAEHEPFILEERTWVLADDSGLEVDALGGRPGVCSARYADPTKGQNTPDAENNAKLLRDLEGVPFERRTARFRCVLAVAEVPPKKVRLFEGVCEGRIVDRPRGSGGFGYDPLFQPAGYDQTFGELPPAVKNQISHRSRALKKLQQWMAEQILLGG